MKHKLVIVDASIALKLHWRLSNLQFKNANVIFGLKTWWYYLYRAKFEVFSDHENLKYLFDKKKVEDKTKKIDGTFLRIMTFKW